jgi:hypothetical protein
VLFVKEVLYSDETVVTLCLTVFSTAIALGSIFCTKISKGNATLKYVPLAACGMAISMLALVIYGSAIGAPELSMRAPLLHVDGYSHMWSIGEFLELQRHWGVLLALFSIAFFGGIYTVPLYTLMQKEADKSQLSRTIAVNNIVNSFFMVAAVVIVVLLYSLGGTVSHVFTLVALATAAIGVILWLRL